MTKSCKTEKEYKEIDVENEKGRKKRAEERITLVVFCAK